MSSHEIKNSAFLSRGRFIKTGLATVALSLSEGIAITGFIRNAFAEELSSSEAAPIMATALGPAILKARQSVVTTESVEAKGVKLLTYSDSLGWVRANCGSMKDDQGVSKNSCGELPLDWEPEHLEVLTEILEVTPDHLYRDTKIILSNTYDAGSVINPIERNKIQVDITDFVQTRKRRALKGSVHEWSHLETPMENPTSSIDGRTVYGLKVASPWFDEIYQILGGEFHVLPGGFTDKVKAMKLKVKDIPRPNPSVGEIDIVERRLIYGMEYYPAELIGVIAEQLLHGKLAFKERFTTDDFFSTEQAKALHDFGVRRIYKGVIFDRFPFD